MRLIINLKDAAAVRHSCASVPLCLCVFLFNVVMQRTFQCQYLLPMRERVRRWKTPIRQVTNVGH